MSYREPDTKELINNYYYGVYHEIGALQIISPNPLIYNYVLHICIGQLACEVPECSVYVWSLCPII